MPTLSAVWQKIKVGALATFAALSPLEGILWAVVALVTLDLLLGIVAAYKRKEPLESNKLKRTVVKLLVYQLTIIVSYGTMHYLTGPEIPLLKIVTSIIGLTEVKSVLENLAVITGNPIFHSFLGALPSAKLPGGRRESNRKRD